MINTATSTVSANLTISPALLIPSLQVGSYTYGTPDPLVTLAGVINGDTVVPTATIRPPLARAAFKAVAVCAEMQPHSACILCSLVSSTFTGRNVPAPTCRVSR